MKKARVLIADDHEIVRRGLRAAIESEPEWKVVGEAVNGREAVEMAGTLAPDVVVMDIGMPELNGLSAIREIRKTNPAARVLVLTVYEAEHVVNEVLSAGAQGYLLKSDAGKELVLALHALLDDRTYFTSKIARMMPRRVPATEAHRETGAGVQAGRLSERERQIVQLLAEGRSCNEVAETLGIAGGTVMAHRKHIMQKIGTRSLAGLVRYAIRNDMITP